MNEPLTPESLNRIFKQAALAGVLPMTVEDAIIRSEHWQEKLAELPKYIATTTINAGRAAKYRNTGRKHADRRGNK